MKKTLMSVCALALLAGCGGGGADIAMRAGGEALAIVAVSDDPLADIQAAAPEWACAEASTIAGAALSRQGFQAAPAHVRGLNALCLLAANRVADRVEVGAVIYADPVVGPACARLRAPVADAAVIEVFRAAGC